MSREHQRSQTAETKQRVLWGNKHFVIANVSFWIREKPKHIKKKKRRKEDLISSLNTAAVILIHHTAVQRPGSCPYLMCPIMHFPVLSSWHIKTFFNCWEKIIVLEWNTFMSHCCWLLHPLSLFTCLPVTVVLLEGRVMWAFYSPLWHDPPYLMADPKLYTCLLDTNQNHS